MLSRAWDAGAEDSGLTHVEPQSRQQHDRLSLCFLQSAWPDPVQSLACQLRGCAISYLGDTCRTLAGSDLCPSCPGASPWRLLGISTQYMLA